MSRLQLVFGYYIVFYHWRTLCLLLIRGWWKLRLAFDIQFPPSIEETKNATFVASHNHVRYRQYDAISCPRRSVSFGCRLHFLTSYFARWSPIYVGIFYHQWPPLVHNVVCISLHRRGRFETYLGHCWYLLKRWSFRWFVWRYSLSLVNLILNGRSFVTIDPTSRIVQSNLRSSSIP